MSYQLISYQLISYQLISCQLISYQLISYQLISYQLQRPFLPDHDIKILVSTADKLSAAAPDFA
jgi:hypothetical protein